MTAALAVDGNTVTIHKPGEVWQGTVSEFIQANHSTELWPLFIAAVAQDGMRLLGGTK